MAAWQAQDLKANPILINNTLDNKSNTKSLASYIFNS